MHQIIRYNCHDEVVLIQIKKDENPDMLEETRLQIIKTNTVEPRNNVLEDPGCEI